jgi:ribonuclease BN (tRNA processing enzyme)
VRGQAFPVNHGFWPAFGFRFDTPDRSMVISGDTKPVGSLIQNSIGCDVLTHEVYSAEGFQDVAPEWQNCHAQVHTSTHASPPESQMSRSAVRHRIPSRFTRR